MWRDVFDRNPYGTNCWLLAADGSDEAVVVDPGSSRRACTRCSRPPASARPPSCSRTRTSTTRWPPATSAGDEVPLYVHPADALAFTDPAAWGAGFANPLAPVKDLRTIADGESLALAGLAIEVLHTPGHTPGHCMLPHRRGRAPALGRPRVRRLDRALGLPELVADRHGGEPPAVPRRCPTACRCCPATGPTTDVGHERASNPFLRDLGAWS